MQFEQRNILADVDKRAAGILADDFVRPPKGRGARDSVRLIDQLVTAGCGIEDAAALGGLFIPAAFAGGEQRFRLQAHMLTGSAKSCGCLCHSSGIPHLERAQSPS